MAFNRFPRAARRNAHRFVVITRRAARCERVAEPEAEFLTDAIGDVGKCGRAFVCGDHQIRILTIPNDHIGRVEHLAVSEIVGQTQ